MLFSGRENVAAKRSVGAAEPLCDIMPILCDKLTSLHEQHSPVIRRINQGLQQDPLLGAILVFLNRRRRHLPWPVHGGNLGYELEYVRFLRFSLRTGLRRYAA